MSASAESERSPRESSAMSEPSSGRRRRWADGRLIHPRDDGIAAWIKFATWCLAGIGILLLGRAGIPTSATMPGAALVVVLAVALAIAAGRVVSVRARSLAERAAWTGTAVGYSPPEAGTATDWWRAARWPDGRFVAATGVVANVAGFAVPVLLAVALWVLGRMSAPDLGVPSWWGSLAAVLMLPTSFMGVASSRRLKALAAKDAAANRGVRAVD